jgi:hypothetical protein
MTDERRDRPAPISYRIPKGREAEFAALVAEHGGSINAFLTDRIFEQRRRNRAKVVGAARKLRPAAALADKLHEIALIADGKIALIVEAAFEDLKELRGELFDDMGREP